MLPHQSHLSLPDTKDLRQQLLTFLEQMQGSIHPLRLREAELVAQHRQIQEELMSLQHQQHAAEAMLDSIGRMDMTEENRSLDRLQSQQHLSDVDPLGQHSLMQYSQRKQSD